MGFNAPNHRRVAGRLGGTAPLCHRQIARRPHHALPALGTEALVNV
jgi:hypothetical protein